MGEAAKLLTSDYNQRDGLELVYSTSRSEESQIFQYYIDSMISIAAEQSHDLITTDNAKVSNIVGIIAAASFFSDMALPTTFPKLYRVADEYATLAGQDSETLDQLESIYDYLGGWGDGTAPRHEAVHMLDALNKELGAGGGAFTRDEFVAVRRRVLAIAFGLFGDPQEPQMGE